MPPSYNVIDLDADEVRIAMRQPGLGRQGEEPLARFARVPVTTSEFYPELERFVRYDADPFAAPSHPAGATSATAPSTGVATAPASEGGAAVGGLVEGGRP